MASKVKKDTSKRRRKSTVTTGIANIRATFNNTIVTITDLNGNTISWGSAGVEGYKGSKKSTPYVAGLVSQKTAKRAIELYSLKEVHVLVNGPGAGRESAVRSLEAAGLTILTIKDVTPVPHNGCRPPKRPRG